MNDIMKNYRIQNSCRNCKFRLEENDYDSDTEYFCNYDKSMMIDVFYQSYYDKTMSQRTELSKWQEKNRVDICGICNNYEIEEFKKE